MPTTYEMKRCREILSRIDQHIPIRGYVKEVQEVYRRKGLTIPSRYRIQQVRAGRTYDLEMVKALQQISQPRDENDELIEPLKWKTDAQSALPFKERA